MQTPVTPDRAQLVDSSRRNAPVRAMSRRRIFGALALGLALGGAAVAATPVVIDVAPNGKAISPDLVGVFFEDLNWAADGGLYAELIQNRSFEYQATEQATWNSLTAWELVQRGEGKGTLAVDAADPVHANNPHYAVLSVARAGDGVGVANAGFDGLPVTAGASYEFSVFTKQLYVGDRWGTPLDAAAAARLVQRRDGVAGPIVVRLESAQGEVLAEASLDWPATTWTRRAATLTAARSDPTARLVVLSKLQGGLAFDVVSLFPQRTFRGRANGLRPDLAQAIADLKPKFMRFPGGCLVHGNGLGNMYRWKDTIGPIEQRRERANLWGYHQSVGLGYFEFFQFCEDLGAKPLPVVPAGVCCQNSGHTNGVGQRGLPLADMPAYIQDVLDLVEYANGPATSAWGAKRAAAGHPAPFGLRYLGVGNEDAQTPEFRERFALIEAAVRAKHPEITVIGTVGPFADGADFEAGWKFAGERAVPFVDEHFYMKPEWFLANTRRYDGFDRAKSKVYLGEYASWGNTWFNALAEAAFLTGLERNGDVVRLASYAPLLAREGHTQWKTDLIFFNAADVLRTPNYHVQRLFSLHGGDTYFPATIAPAATPAEAAVAFSCVKDSAGGDVVLKFVNPTAAAESAVVNLPAEFGEFAPTAECVVLTGDPAAKNTFAVPNAIAPQSSAIAVARSFTQALPAHSVTVVRLHPRR